MAPDDADPADTLYALPLAEFTAARDRLAAERRKAGDAAAARALKELRKPSVSAWAVNQAVRRAPAGLEALLTATDELLRAQAEAGASDLGRARFRRATETQRQAVEALVATAREALAEAGMGTSAAVLERVANDLRWGAAGEDTRALLRAGRLAMDLEPQDFGALLGRISPAAVPEVRAARTPAPALPTPASPEAPREESRAEETRRQLERDRREAEARRAAKAAALRAAQRETAGARRDLEQRRAAVGRVRARVEELRAELARRQEELRVAEAAETEALARVEELQRREAALDEDLASD